MGIIYFAIVLSTVVFVHELGHFIFAKRAGVYVYEFAIGMGPRLFKFNRKKDETTYSLRLFPIGGYCSMAGEGVELEDNVPMGTKLQDKSWFNRFKIIIGGVLFNFIFTIIVLFVIALFNGSPQNEVRIGEIVSGSGAFYADLKSNHIITAVNGVKVNTYDKFMIEFSKYVGKDIILTVNGEQVLVKNIDGKYGFSIDQGIEEGFVAAVKYSFTKFYSLLETIIITISDLISGSLDVSNMAGPIGIYTVVDSTAESGLWNLVFLTAYLSLNVGFINLIPIPAFDGGRLLFLIIEKVIGRSIDSKIENIIHAFGFIILMFLMLFVTFNDISRVIGG